LVVKGCLLEGNLQNWVARSSPAPWSSGVADPLEIRPSPHLAELGHSRSNVSSTQQTSTGTYIRPLIKYKYQYHYCVHIIGTRLHSTK